MATMITTATIQNEADEAAELAATFDSLAFMAGLDNADPDWVRDMGITAEHLRAIKAEGLITTEFESWYPYLQDHLWGVRRNHLDFVIRYIPKVVRLDYVAANGHHSFVGHTPELIVDVASRLLGMQVIPSNGLSIYIADRPVVPIARPFQVDVLLEQAEDDFYESPCSIHGS